MQRARSRRRVMSQRWGRRSVILTPSEKVGVGGLRSEVKNDARNERDRRLGEIFFFDDAVDVSQVIAKCVAGIGCSLLEVTGEVQLCAQRPSGLDSFRLSPLRFPNVPGGYKQLFDIFRADENAAVVICENDITRLHLEIAEARMPER